MENDNFLSLCWCYVRSMDRTTPMAKDRWEFVNHTGSPSVRAFAIRKGGRFGNAVIQLVHAIHLAKLSGVKRIYVGELDLPPDLHLTDARFDDIELVATRPPSNEPVLRGHFFFLAELERLHPSASDRLAITRALAFGYLFKDVRLERKCRRKMVIHIRSGDIFSDAKPHKAYAQPPLSYYKFAIQDARRRYSIDSVHVVFEDRANPCIDALEQYLSETRLKFIFTSDGFLSDARMLLSASILCMGVGTFGPIFSMMAPHLKAAYRFRDFILPNMAMPPEADMHLIEDSPSGYIGDWCNTSEQRSMMLEFPMSSLKISTCPREKKRLIVYLQALRSKFLIERSQRNAVPRVCW